MATTLARIEFRRKTAAQWTSSNEVLLASEPGVETDTGKFKLGDGTTGWSALPYQAPTAASIAAASATLWKPNTAYVAGQAVVNPSGFIVTALTGFTSTSSYSAANWSDPVAATYLPLTTALLDWAYSQSYRLVSATRDTNEAITTGSVVWPDGATGTFTTDTASTAFPGAIDAYHVTHVLSGVTKTVTQTAVTRDAGGAVTAQPALTVA